MSGSFSPSGSVCITMDTTNTSPAFEVQLLNVVKGIIFLLTDHLKVISKTLPWTNIYLNAKQSALIQVVIIMPPQVKFLRITFSNAV